jgi:TfoX/Sxy family transcriptional regulator of competence genes
MAYDQQIATKLRAALAQQPIDDLREKNMFGRLGFMVNGKLATCVGSKDVMYKLSAERCNELVASGVANPVVMANRTAKEWVTIDFAHLEDASVFQSYLTECLDYATGKN